MSPHPFVLPKLDRLPLAEQAVQSLLRYIEQHQLPGLLAVAANHGFQRIERVKQEVGIDLRMQQFNF